MDLRCVIWVVLTQGNRPQQLRRAVSSLLADDVESSIVVVSNGGGPIDVAVGMSAEAAARVTVLELDENLGAPGGRDHAVRAIDCDIVGFLDDDAELGLGATARIRDAFLDDTIGAVTLRLVDEDGATQRRHLPRIGDSGADEGGDVALILEGASAIRRSAYLDAGGYFTDLFYAHEAVELCWRLVDHGWRIMYLADVEVFHPRTTIERHADGWELTGRNRVLIARRTLPWPVAFVHVCTWLVLGVRRAPAGECRQRYLTGWRRGWGIPVERAPISWSGVLRLTRLGRPPIV